jgi:hypothetical protein
MWLLFMFLGLGVWLGVMLSCYDALLPRDCDICRRKISDLLLSKV